MKGLRLTDTALEPGHCLRRSIFSSYRPKLVPFQGSLTDASGTAIPEGAKVVEFKMYDAPIGGSVKWAGEVNKLSINGGLVNTMLGSKAGLGAVEFSTSSFLRITVDANGDGSITAADPPMLPRQSVVGSVCANEAGNARKLAGLYWSVAFVDGNGVATNEPISGFINGPKVATGSIADAQLSGNAVTTEKVLTGAITTDKIVTGTPTVSNLLEQADCKENVRKATFRSGDISHTEIRNQSPPQSSWIPMPAKKNAPFSIAGRGFLYHQIQPFLPRSQKLLFSKNYNKWVRILDCKYPRETLYSKLGY